MKQKPIQPFGRVSETGETEPAYVSIKDWAEEDRPREKMLAKGEEALTTAELLAILIGSGSAKKSAVELMGDVLKDCNGRLVLLNRLSVEDLMSYHGIGMAKAITLKAASELGRRRALEEMAHTVEQFDTAQQVYDYMRPLIQDLNHEESWVLLMNNNARLIKLVRISQGGRTDTSVDIRIVMKHALLAEATTLILVHNHPSGNARPSKADETLTMRLRDAAKTMCMHLIDHVIVTDGDYYSFAENGML